MNARFFVSLGFIGMMLGGLGNCFAANGAGLTATSPFLPPVENSANRSERTAWVFEFRGIITGSEGTLFSIYDRTKKKAVWVGLNEQGQEFLVRSHQVVEGRDIILVEAHGITQMVEFAVAKISATDGGSPAQVATRDPGPMPDPWGIRISDLTRAEEGRLEILAAQVRTRLARQNPTGSASTELLPAEQEKLKMFAAQVRTRLANENRAR